MEVLEEAEEIVIIQDRQAKIEQLMNDLLRGEKSLSYSSLKAFKESPNDFVEYVLKEKIQTEAMFFGLVLHCLVLEPGKFEERYFVIKDSEKCNEIGGAKPRSTNLYKEWKADLLLKNIGKEAVSFKDYQSAKAISDNVRYNRASAKVLSLCPESEVKIEWEYKNFKFRGFIDKKGNTAIGDLKKMPSASPKKAQRTIVDMGYHIQAAMYLRGIGKIIPYYIIAVDAKGGVSVHRLSKHLIEHGFDEYDRLTDKFNDCLINENFNQSYDFYAEGFDGIYIADKPAYLY